MKEEEDSQPRKYYQAVGKSFIIKNSNDIIDNMKTKENTLRKKLTTLNKRDEMMITKLESIQREIDEMIRPMK
jgi:chaperonin cofactor prefoldin